MDNLTNSNYNAHHKKLEEMIGGLSNEEFLVICDAMAKKNPYIMLEAISKRMGVIETRLFKLRCAMEEDLDDE